MGIPEQAMRNRKLFQTYFNEFEQIFKLKLKTYLNISSPVDLIVGFNIIKFDEDIRTPEGGSCKNHIIATYGERAGEIISKLL